jgi:hypothetical protein
LRERRRDVFDPDNIPPFEPTPEDAEKLRLNAEDFERLETCPDVVPEWLVLERNKAELEGRA